MRTARDTLMSNASSSTAIVYALLANLGIAVAKTVAAVITKSGAMLAEAIHSFADCANQLLLFLGLRQSKKAPTAEHPMGYGRETYFWAFIVAILLFSIGGMFSIYEGIHKIQHPEHIKNAAFAIGVLVLAIVLESFSLAGAVRVIKQRKEPLWKFFVTSRESELIVVLAEDVAALVGLIFALLAVIATVITDNPLFDALGSLFIGIVLVCVAVTVGYEVKQLLIGKSAEPKEQDEILKFINNRKEVDKVYNMITQHYGPDIMVAVKVKMKEEKDVRKIVLQTNQIERDLKAQFPKVKFSFFEIDNKK
ncbi:MAG: cation diffusion facilitator family transporter [archaeon]